MTTRPRVYRYGSSIVVIGASDALEACKAAGISPTTHRWAGTDFGPYARRRGQWRPVNGDSPPKDARPGVCFLGPITSASGRP